MQLVPSGLAVPTQAIIERQLVGDFPGVLYVDPDSRLANLRITPVVDGRAVHRAEQEAGVWKSDRAATDIGRSEIRKSGFRGGKIVPARSADADEAPVVHPPFRPGLVSVIAA